jgi:hypothetical protein
MQQVLRREYLYAHAVWCSVAVNELSVALHDNVMNDDWNSSTRRASWEALNVVVESEDHQTVEEKIYLPFQPSHYLLAFFYSISKEIHRIGSHTLDKVHTLIYMSQLTRMTGSVAVFSV